MDKIGPIEYTAFKEFLNNIYAQFSIQDENEKEKLENILNLERDPEWAIRILILKWWLDSSQANSTPFNEFTESACRFTDKESIISRFLDFIV